MTTASRIFQAWDTKPAGKAVRVVFAVLGILMGTLVLMASAMGIVSWAWMPLGVVLAATSVWAANVPSVARLTPVAITLTAIFLLQVF